MVNSQIAIKQLNRMSELGRKMRLAAEEWDSDFQTLIAIILSARNLDEITIKYATILFEKYPDAKSLSKALVEDVEKIIFPINFYKNKSKYILDCAKQLVNKYKGIPPKDFDKLIELKGVGRKTANVFLAENHGDNIGVDTHLSYISNYLNWTKNHDPHKIEKDLENLFPKKYWGKINPLVVRFGKTYTNRTEKNKILDEIKKIN